MRLEITSNGIGYNAPALQVGDELNLTARVRVTGVVEEQVDVASWGDEPTFMSGDRVVSLHLSKVELKP